ncbi:UDP-N-acetylmuramate--L-alanine ligase, partial [Streptococcus pneumoniae]|nr:UDP-N-acetylmuramate--L-alanine ligase [Streptococcus pneumoniae]
DFDHPDYFTSLEDVFNAFNDYAKQITKGLFVYGEDAELRKITANAPIYYYGFESDNNDFVASDLLRSTTGSTFTVH